MLDLYVDPWDDFDADDERRRAREDRENRQPPVVIGALVIVTTGLMSVLLGSAWPMLLTPLAFLVCLGVAP